MIKCTTDSESGMKSFTDVPRGEDKSVMVRNFAESFFGTTPIGDVRKFGSGGTKNGPATRFALSSDKILSNKSSG